VGRAIRYLVEAVARPSPGWARRAEQHAASVPPSDSWPAPRASEARDRSTPRHRPV